LPGQDFVLLLVNLLDLEGGKALRIELVFDFFVIIILDSDEFPSDPVVERDQLALK
jgi:hypothetical protein